MDFLHYEFDAQVNDVIEVILDRPANVQLMDPGNFENYRHRRPYRYHGGFVRESPFRVAVPRTGHWHVTVDLGGAAGRVRASARLIPTAQGVAT